MEMKELLTRVREGENLNMRQFAEKIGVPYHAYRKYEVEGVMPPAIVIIKIAKALQVTADYILGLSDEPHPKKYDDKEVTEAFALRDALKTVMTK